VLSPGLRAPALPGFLAGYVPWPGRQPGNPVKAPATERACARRDTWGAGKLAGPGCGAQGRPGRGDPPDLHV